MVARERFTSRFRFLMVVTGSVVGLGNIWSFPTQTATNGGIIYVGVYFLMALFLAYPVLMVEMIIGRYTGANILTALQSTARGRASRFFAGMIGFSANLAALMVLAFYCIVAGTLLSWMAASFFSMFDIHIDWLHDSSLRRNVLFAGLFMLAAILISGQGLVRGLERWSVRLMPGLLILLLIMAAYVLSEPGSQEGLKAYLSPDVSHLYSADIYISAMGQAFFSLSLGIGIMVIYGSYLQPEFNLPKLGLGIILIDTVAALLAGLVILPALYVAYYQGINVFDGGVLVGGMELVFGIMPKIFDGLGAWGAVVAFSFYGMLSVAALTSAISALEVPVSYACERMYFDRWLSVIIMAGLAFCFTCLILFNIRWLFEGVHFLTTSVLEPAVGLACCLFLGWVWRRDQLLEAVASENADFAESLFWRLWPSYVRFICPVLIVLVLFNKW
ncbi:NSS family neurotransmitter:Na+ symporter [Sinobacterium caligoides]|uniref:NSS family neurotransmitter:Na+ symporter n=1 Tax=Sinobacterium caligoides TaxID=933926 RepID=A0A3N2DPW9_9GAMM|nr:sodium-dependent transporter [Sinobacterium caligoides]ROS01837.1 NSS family neurotransmitter:Na+ symporter [Sinobacterium caligoides]